MSKYRYYRYAFRTIGENSERAGSHQHLNGEEAIMAHKSIDSQLPFGYGIDTEALNSVYVPAIEHARDYSEVIVIDESGKFAVERKRICRGGKVSTRS